MTISREVGAIIEFVEAAGVPHRVTATLGHYVSPTNPCSPHTARSLHCADGTDGNGLAVDFGGVTPGVTTATVAQMAAIWHLFEPMAPKLAELFFNGPGITRVVKNGVWRDGAATLGAAPWAAHRTHVHIAVPRGVFLAPTPTAVPRVEAHTQTVPIPIHDFEEQSVKQTMMVIGKLDENGRGWSDWDPGLGRDPNIVGLVLLGPSPADDGYWLKQEKVQLSAQPRGGKVRVVVRGGAPGDTVTCFVAVS